MNKKLIKELIIFGIVAIFMTGFVIGVVLGIYLEHDKPLIIIEDKPTDLTYHDDTFTISEMGIVDFSVEIDEYGGVSYDTPSYVGDITYYNWSKSSFLNIYNNQSDQIMFLLKLTNPWTDEQGLNDNLETDAFNVNYDINISFYTDGVYTESGVFFTIEENETIKIPIYFRLDPCPSGTFQDGQIYNCCFYLINYNDYYDKAIQKVSFVVRT